MPASNQKILIKPDILAIIERETGEQLQGRGRKTLYILCPFHEEKTPSFKVDPERQTFHCFGCGAHGDAITFVMKRRNLTFGEVVKLLGIDYRPDPEELRKRELVKKFRQWERRTFNEISDAYRACQQEIVSLRLPEEIDHLAVLYKLETLLEHRLDVLTFGGDGDKFDLWRELANGKF